MSKLHSTIALLSADCRPEKTRNLYLILFFIMPFALIGWWGLGQVTEMPLRKDYPEAILRPFVMAKHAFPFIVAVLGIIQLRKFYHVGKSHTYLQWSLWIVFAVLMIFVGTTFFETQSDQRLNAIIGKTLWQCTLSVLGIGMIIWAGLMYYLSHGATRNPRTAGFIAGITAGSFGAFLYAMGCMEDSPLFYGIWYSLIILAVGAFSSFVAPKILRW